MTDMAVKKIAIFGNGLAGLLCAAKLVKILPEAVELIYVEGSKASETDIFFGTVTPPSTYDFLLGLDISEPDFLPVTNTSFSLGTRYENWGPETRSWTQSFYRPLPAYNGVGFHHYLTRLKSDGYKASDIEPYIMSVEAANAGVFAHPPEGQNIPLKDIEYGYHILPEVFRGLLTAKVSKTRVKWIQADIADVQRQGENITSVSLSNGQTLNADFMIDALGPHSKLPHSKLIVENAQKQSSTRQLRAVSSFVQSEKTDGVCRALSGTDFGWQSRTPLQNGTHYLTVFAPESEAEAMKTHGGSNPVTVQAEIGKLATPWSGNCMTLGHGAAVLEPLTPAPIQLLQRDIERLAELIPVTAKMTVESREYNRRFTADYNHAEMFHRAFFVSENVEKTSYFEAATESSPDPKLLGKIQQFKARGVLVQYDYEPFDERDWTLLHLGMGRNPDRYDPLADHIPEGPLKNRLTQMRASVEMMAKKMPPHHVYMTGLLKYLKEKHG